MVLGDVGTLFYTVLDGSGWFYVVVVILGGHEWFWMVGLSRPRLELTMDFHPGMVPHPWASTMLSLPLFLELLVQHHDAFKDFGINVALTTRFLQTIP